MMHWTSCWTCSGLHSTSELGVIPQLDQGAVRGGTWSALNDELHLRHLPSQLLIYLNAHGQ
jgi:hypothetical protein